MQNTENELLKINNTQHHWVHQGKKNNNKKSMLSWWERWYWLVTKCPLPDYAPRWVKRGTKSAKTGHLESILCTLPLNPLCLLPSLCTTCFLPLHVLCPLYLPLHPLCTLCPVFATLQRDANGTKVLKTGGGGCNVSPTTPEWKNFK